MKHFKLIPAVLLTMSFISVLGCSSAPQKETTAEYIDDSYLTTKVKAAILRQPAD